LASLERAARAKGFERIAARAKCARKRKAAHLADDTLAPALIFNYLHAGFSGLNTAISCSVSPG
jgi:hypothetical protein